MSELIEKEKDEIALNEVIVVEGVLTEAMSQCTNLAEYKKEEKALNG